ncbi:MAG TPA: hypothetical protein PLE75_01560 [Ferruginibacter sp.]|nr:hypothetical protein [Ferruginibacter sp.]HRO05342.1 hypothetical protein [Ferruginibacter sp.]HRO96414.1 hypothetical protein [Ferruginibacter sp.]HRP48560.1 hypothetical protein [Ferruginibacter sp.]
MKDVQVSALLYSFYWREKSSTLQAQLDGKRGLSTFKGGSRLPKNCIYFPIKQKQDMYKIPKRYQRSVQ